MDYVLNGQGHGTVADVLMQHNFDPRALRPWVGEDGRSYVTVNQKGKDVALVTNAPATLRRDEWKHFDDAVIKAAKPRLRAFADLRAAGLTYTVPNAMGKTVLEYETMGDITPATISMDGMRRSENDRPEFDVGGLPLPITHKDFSFSARQLATSRNGNTPLDTTMAELAGRRVAEEVEKLTLGITSSFTYAGRTVYGYTNLPARNIYGLTDPTDLGWLPSTLVAEIIAMKAMSTADNHFGPWILYASPGWDTYLDNDYSEAKGDNTLRERIGRIDGITSIRTLEYLTGLQLILVQMVSSNVRAVIGMDITTLQWETHGGMMLHFKVMCILVPQLRGDQAGQSGIVHGSVA